MEKEKVVSEIKKQLILAGPLIIANGLQFILQVISNMFVGHLGELALSGATMATSFAGVTGFSLMLGMASALDTLCGQAYGAMQPHMLGIHMQRAMLVLTLVCIPLAFIWVFTTPILVLLHQDHEISREAGLYARWMIPSLFGYALLQCQNRFLQTQNAVLSLLLTSGITLLLHILFCWVLVFKLGLGIKGSALAISISYWVNVVLLALYIKLSSACKTTWTGFSKEAFRDVYKFIKLAIPSAAMVCLEFWSFEVLVLVSGLLPNPKLKTSVTSISLNTTALVYMITMGLGAAASTRVSNELGASNPQAARLAISVVVSMTILEGLTMGMIMILVRRIWGRAYSNEVDVVQHVASMMPLLALSHVADGIQCVLSGIARGCGWQKICAFINLGSYYIVGIPTSMIMAFVRHTGTQGLWTGIICALFVQASLLSVITLRTDWDKEVKKASDRVYESTIPVQTTTTTTRSSNTN